jgi:hypothetical protein
MLDGTNEIATTETDNVDSTDATPAPDAPAESTPPSVDASAPSAPQVEGAPETYADFTAPQDTTLNPEVLSQFKGIAKDLNLSQGNAQKLIDTLAPTIAKQNLAALENAQKQLREDWATKAKSDVEFLKGADSDPNKNFESNLAVAKKALETYGSPDLLTLFQESGIGNHPEVIRFALRVGKTLQQDSKHVQGSTSAGGGNQSIRSFYPNSNHAN